MADFGGPPVANQINTPNMQTLSGMMNVMQQQQNLQTGQFHQQEAEAGAQNQQQQMAERQTLQKMMLTGQDPDGNPIKDPNTGEVSPVALSAAVNKYMPLTGQDVIQHVVKSMDDRLKLNDSVRQLGQNYRNDLSGIIGAAIKTDANASDIGSKLDDYASQNPAAAQTVAMAKQNLQHLPDVSSVQDPALQAQLQAAHDKKLLNIQQTFLPASTVAAEQQPAMTGVTTPGGKFQPVQTNPLSAVPMGSAGPATQQGIAPQVYTNAAGQPVFLGAGPSPIAAASPGGANTPFPANYNVQGMQSATANMTNHFDSLNAAAQSMPLTTALTKTIQGLAPTAFTGVGGDKKQYTAGLMNALGIGDKFTGNSQTDTNLMNKAMAQLNISTPAGTDAARALVEAGQPNSHMNQAAIQEAAGTIAGQVKMNVAERNFLNSTRYENGGAGDPQAYQQGRQWFEQNADPRIWQYEDLMKNNPAQAKAFIARQPDKADLITKTQALAGAGFFK